MIEAAEVVVMQTGLPDIVVEVESPTINPLREAVNSGSVSPSFTDLLSALTVKVGLGIVMIPFILGTRLRSVIPSPFSSTCMGERVDRVD